MSLCVENGALKRYNKVYEENTETIILRVGKYAYSNL
jgi:hypothetical protein